MSIAASPDTLRNGTLGACQAGQFPRIVTPQPFLPSLRDLQHFESLTQSANQVGRGWLARDMVSMYPVDSRVITESNPRPLPT
jgi:hypothetical protein